MKKIEKALVGFVFIYHFAKQYFATIKFYLYIYLVVTTLNSTIILTKKLYLYYALKYIGGMYNNKLQLTLKKIKKENRTDLSEYLSFLK